MTGPSEGALPTEAGWAKAGVPTPRSFPPASVDLPILSDTLLGSPPSTGLGPGQGLRKCWQKASHLGEGDSLLQDRGMYCLMVYLLHSNYLRFEQEGA